MISVSALMIAGLCLLGLSVPGTPATQALPENAVTFSDKSGTAQTNYPVQIGRPFAQGQIQDYPEAVLDGSPVLTQADIKMRWPDGSVKHAVLSFIIPELPAGGSVKVTFQNQSSGNNTPLTQDEMLGPAYDFDAAMELTVPGKITARVSAREMLRNGDYEFWTSGPVATTIILRDHSAARKYDLGFERVFLTRLTANADPNVTTFTVKDASGFAPGGIFQVNEELIRVCAVNQATNVISVGNVSCPGKDGRAWANTVAGYHWNNDFIATETWKDTGDRSFQTFRPIFYATFWPALNKVRVRYVGENSNTEALQDINLDNLVLTLGYDRPQTVYELPSSKKPLFMTAASRWTKEFWSGGPPEPQINIDHNLAYLAAANFIANYDTSVVPLESAIEEDYNQRWLPSRRDLYDAGMWQKFMPGTGGRYEIALYNLWTVFWLYTGDWRSREMALGQADLAAAWPMYFREADPTKYLDRHKTEPGLGRVMSISTRPTLSFHWGMTPYFASAEDRVEPVGIFTRRGWEPEAAHIPEPMTMEYLLTGDHFRLEQSIFWAGWSIDQTGQGDLQSVVSRGPAGVEGGIGDQTRGEAWVFRNLYLMSSIIPDSMPGERQYFHLLAEDAIANWEGQRQIRGTPNDGNTMWQWGNMIAQSGDGSAKWVIGSPDGKVHYLGLPPLHIWGTAITAIAGMDKLDKNVTDSAWPPWMESYLLISLGRARELGYKTDALISWLGSSRIGQLIDPTYNPWLSAAYYAPATGKSQKWFPDWAAVKSGFIPSYQNLTDWDPGVYPTSIFGYNHYVQASVSFLINEPGGAEAWDKIVSMNARYYANAMPNGPQWAFVPRQGALGNPAGALPLASIPTSSPVKRGKDKAPARPPVSRRSR